MKALSVWQIDMLPWYAFLVYWLVTGFRVKPTKRTEPLAARLFTLLLTGLAFALMFSQWAPFGWLRWRVVEPSAAITWAGVALTYAGAGIAIWARTVLGSNWSARVTVKQGHELTRTGPYAYVRHPIYTGLLLAMLGTSWVVGEWRGFVAIALIAICHALKAKREEAAMIGEFGVRYEEYRQGTGFLLPRF